MNLKFLKKEYKFKRNTKKIFKAKPFICNANLRTIVEKTHIKYKISIRINANNIFCSLKQEKVLMSCSAGKYKIEITKRKLKYNSKLVLENFFTEVLKTLKKNDILLINLSSPKKLRKFLVKQMSLKFKNLQTILKINELKCFNGCRPKKQRRKKRKGLKIIKK